MSEKINDDVFEYESGGFSQCISGFGRNAVETINTMIDEDEKRPGEVTDITRESIKWHIGELVRWCRHFNGECKQLKAAASARS